jgi:hypothetical protein
VAPTIFEAKRADGPTAIWLAALLGGAADAAGIAAPPPAELRPTGRFAGLCSSLRYDPDRRVSLSSKAVSFWSRRGIVTVYLHEACHRLTDEAGADGFAHDANFYCLNLCLLMRLDQKGFLPDGQPAQWRFSMSNYDLQDPPPAFQDHEESIWYPRVLAWSMTTAAEHTHKDCSAEELAKLIFTRYKDQCKAWSEEPAKAAQQKRLAAAAKRAAAADAELHAQQRANYQLAVALAWLFFIAFFAAVYLLLTRMPR